MRLSSFYFAATLVLFFITTVFLLFPILKTLRVIETCGCCKTQGVKDNGKE